MRKILTISFVRTERTIPKLHKPGLEKIIDYTKYGVFQNVGKENYHYRMTDPQGLAAAVGEGIYPNTGDIYTSTRYKELKNSGKLEGSHWDYLLSDDLEATYYKWFTAD